MRGRLALLGDSATGSLPPECQRTPDNIDDSSTAFYVDSGTLLGCQPPLEMGSAHPTNVIEGGSIAGYLCHIMLICAHSDDAS